MVKFIYKHGGDNHFKSPFNGLEFIFIGKNPTDIVNSEDIELLRKCDGFIEVNPIKISTEIVNIIKTPKIETINIETIMAIPEGKVAPIPKSKKNRK